MNFVTDACRYTTNFVNNAIEDERDAIEGEEREVGRLNEKWVGWNEMLYSDEYSWRPCSFVRLFVVSLYIRICLIS
jgi:hypothetical protein